MPHLTSEDRDRTLLLPALLGVVAGQVLRRRRRAGPLEPATIVAAALVAARPASRLGGWLADEIDVADRDSPTRFVLAFTAGLALVYVSDALGGRVPRLGRYGT
jgi:hypothetical protein